MKYAEPHIIIFEQIGESSIGFISVADPPKVPFPIKRVFWTYFTPESVVRGGHAHYKTEQILIAASGRITVTTENRIGERNVFILESANIGLYLPPFIWHTEQHSHSSTQLVIASSDFSETDYVRDYDAFKIMK